MWQQMVQVVLYVATNGTGGTVFTRMQEENFSFQFGT
jgi:hypothetical protein